MLLNLNRDFPTASRLVVSRDKAHAVRMLEGLERFLKADPWNRTLTQEEFQELLRHCAVTNLGKAGVSDSVIMSISGHKTDAVFRKYGRIDRDDRKNAPQRVESLIDMGMTLVENHAAL